MNYEMEEPKYIKTMTLVFLILDLIFYTVTLIYNSYTEIHIIRPYLICFMINGAFMLSYKYSKRNHRSIWKFRCFSFIPIILQNAYQYLDTSDTAGLLYIIVLVVLNIIFCIVYRTTKL